MTLTLPDFLLARIAEDEVAIRRASMFPPRWVARPDDVGQPIIAGSFRVATCAESVMDHIARHDPARVLAECEAKRRVVEMQWHHLGEDDYAWGMEEAKRQILAELALPYADHPDYREEWRP